MTLTAAQVKAAGAAAGTGNHLFFRLTAVNTKGAGTAKRPYPYLQSVAPKPVAPKAGTPLRVASFNVRTARTSDGPSWLSRVAKVAATIDSRDPGVVAVQEPEPRPRRRQGRRHHRQRAADRQPGERAAHPRRRPLPPGPDHAVRRARRRRRLAGHPRAVRLEPVPRLARLPRVDERPQWSSSCSMQPADRGGGPRDAASVGSVGRACRTWPAASGSWSCRCTSTTARARTPPRRSATRRCVPRRCEP
nr:hypothetical protein [Angustibacter aerolatus]